MFIYVNNILKESTSARARQVYENEVSFKKVLSPLFLSIFADDFLFSRIFKNENNIVRKLFFHLYFIYRVLFINRTTIVYSRNLSIVFLALKLGFKGVWEAHDLPKDSNKKFLKALINKCRIISISQALADKIYEDYAVKKELILIAHDGVDIDIYDRLRNIDVSVIRRKFNIPLNRKVILHSGSIMKERGSALIKDVLDNLPDWYFIQVGGKTIDIDLLKKDLISYPNFAVISNQKVEDLVQLQLCSEALFYMITKETSTYWCCSPMKIFEYLAAGKPIVASNIGSLNEILSNEVAYLFDPEDKVTLRNSLSQLNDEKSSAIISKNAINLVRQKFTWDIRALQILKFLEE